MARDCYSCSSPTCPWSHVASIEYTSSVTRSYGDHPAVGDAKIVRFISGGCITGKNGASVWRACMLVHLEILMLDKNGKLMPWFCAEVTNGERCVRGGGAHKWNHPLRI